MLIDSKEKIDPELRKKISIELCASFTKRLNPNQNFEIKAGAIIAIKNFIKESRIEDPILFSFLVDAIADPEKEIRKLAIKVIVEVANCEIVELLEIKLKESDGEIKREIGELLKLLKAK